MPLVNSSDPSANGDGKVRSHHFPGANTFLPLMRNDHQQLQSTIDFMQANRLRVSIDKPVREDAIQTRQALDENIRDFEETPFFYYLGESPEIRVAISNQGVGHDFPGGTIDINEAWVEFLVMDATGRHVYSNGTLRSDNTVDPAGYFYRYSLPSSYIRRKMS